VGRDWKLPFVAGIVLGAAIAAPVAAVVSRYLPARGAAHARAKPVGDSIAIAERARGRCGGLPYEEKRVCYEGVVVPLAAAGSVRLAMGALHRLGTLDPDVVRGGHVLAHAVGIAAGRAGGDVLATFETCTEVFQSGCYHGVIQAYFEREEAIDAERVNALCRPYAAPGADRWLRFQCVHGVGHGLTMVQGHDLPRALAGCDLLADAWDRESCYGGAFMENVVHAVAPHHPPPAPAPRAGHDAHAATAGGGESRTAFKPIDPADPHYPCSILDSRYLPACYLMQASVILRHHGGDVAATLRTCGQAPAGLRRVCVQSLGRDVNAIAERDHGRAISLCALADSTYEPWCHVGVVKNIVDQTAKPEDGFSYCRDLTAPPNKLRCYEAVGHQIASLRAELPDRAALCRRAELAYRAACEYGAQVSRRRPPGLRRAEEVP
jgi:hypothetical protein